jgi:hypothetical protein
MELNKVSYKFKICICTNQYSRALSYLEAICSYIEELFFEDVELIRRLKKGLLDRNGKYFKNLRKTEEEESAKQIKFALKSVLDNYSETLKSECVMNIEKMLECVNNLFPKVKKNKLIAIMLIIRAKLLVFMYESSTEEKGKYLELAYGNYKKAVEISMKFMSKMDITRLKVFYSYCKFLFMHMEDKYRGVLFCMNLIKEINEYKNEDEENLENFYKNPDYVKIEEKFKKFCERNLEEYNKVVRLYHS